MPAAGSHMAHHLRDVVADRELTDDAGRPERLVEVPHGQSARTRRAGRGAAERVTARWAK
jgi:hypothetical protein